MFRSAGWLHWFLEALLLLAWGAASAQGYPSRAVTLVMNFPPGAGALEFMVRSVADQASKDLHQTVVVEYKPGAGGTIGASHVAAARPDGHTLLAAVDTTFTVNPSIYRKLAYDPQRSFVHVATLGTFAQMLVINPSRLPVGDFAEFVGKARAESLQFASAGNGSPGHVTAEMLAGALGVKFEHVAYKGNAPATQALLAGEVPFGFLVTGGVLAHVKSGRLRGLAVSSPRRSGLEPALPAVAESGYPGFAAEFGWVLSAPAGTPDEVVTTWNEIVRRTLGRPDVSARLARDFDVTVTPLTPAQTAERLGAESARWAAVIQRAGIRAD